MTDLQKNIGRMLLSFWIPFGGTVAAILVGYGTNEARLSDVEDHTISAHPNEDYRKLLDERDKSLQADVAEIRRRLTILEHRR